MKSIVILSIGLLLVFGWHFATVFGFYGNAPQTQGEFFARLGLIFIGFLVVSAITAAVVAKRSGLPPVPDEREDKVLLKTERIGAATLYVGLLLITWLVFTPLTPMQVANAILAVVCVTEIVKLIYGMTILNTKL
jgi:hypothetical protein